MQPSSFTRRHVTQGVIPHAKSHMMNIGHFKWKKVNFIELFIFEFKHCSSIHHIQQENIIENQHKMSNMWNVFIFRNSPALRDMFTSNIHSFCVTWWQLHFSDSHFLTQILWCFTLVQTKKCVFKLILSEVRCLYVWDRIFNKFCTLNALFIGVYYDCLSPFFCPCFPEQVLQCFVRVSS